MARSSKSKSKSKSQPSSPSPAPAGAGGGIGGGKKAGGRALLLGGAALAVAGAAAYRRFSGNGVVGVGRSVRPDSYDADVAALGWGELDIPPQKFVGTPDGGQLAVWDIGDAKAPTVVLPHCWGCSHAIWIPVARRLLEAGNRVVLYDQRGHGASGRGTAPLSIEMLANDLAAVLEACDVHDAVLAGHSMGGMTIMALATYRPEVLKARARALVLVATAAAQMAPGTAFAPGVQLAASFIGSPVVTRVMKTPNGHRFVRNVFGVDPVQAHMELTARAFAECNGSVRGGFMTAMASMNLLEGIATIDMPTTVLVGSRDRLTMPASADQMVATIPGARLVTLKDRGHMLPLEDPDTVSDEIIRAVKG
jgi:pimeloyl-ACP methyl ester carboxylesterase